MRLLILLLAATTLLASEPDLAYEIGLTGALHPEGKAPDPDGPTLMLEVSRRGGVWERVWGAARNYNLGLHSGRVLSAAPGADGLVIELAMRIEGDAWVAGGRAVYRVELRAQADGGLAGTWTGTLRGTAISGPAFGRIQPQVATRAGFVPMKPCEHPRILFRASDLPALRAKAQTELGRMALARMGGSEGDGDAIGMGVKWQITGDRAFADQAMESVKRHMANQTGGALAIGRAWGPRMEQVAVAYDLCYDAWPAEFKRTVESYLRWITFLVYNDQSKLSRSINWNVTSNYAGPIYSGAAFAGLALWGEPGPEPAKPSPPSAVAKLPPAPADWTPPAGVPVVPFEQGVSPKAWLATQALPQAIALDPMQTLDGRDTEIPTPGAVWNIDGQDWTWAPLAAEHVLEKGGISLEKGLKKDKAVTCFFFTVIDNPEPRRIKVRAPFSKAGRVQVVLAGQRVAHEQVVELERGRYPMLVALRLGAKWGSLEPWFDPVTDADIERSQQLLAARQSEYEAQLADWEFERAEWQRGGGMDQAWVRLHEQGRRMMYLFAREGLGRGGYQAESGHYFLEAMSGPDRYHGSYRNAFGRPVSTLEDMSHYLMRVICASAYGGSGEPLNQGINAALELNGGIAASIFPLVPEPWQAGVLWAWNRHVGGDPLKPDLAKIVGAAPIQAFLNYPLDLQPKAPAEAGFPRTWQAPDYGYFAFRNRWQDRDDIILQAFGRCRSSGGWGGNDAGTIRLLGFGQVWAHGNEARETRRYLESVVMFPQNEYATHLLGRLVEATAAPDGSGSVTFDLSDLTHDLKDKNGWP
ncbi:MAG: hypothetical protein RL456_3363, partial [Pseudomonadota bacterium]